METSRHTLDRWISCDYLYFHDISSKYLSTPHKLQFMSCKIQQKFVYSLPNFPCISKLCNCQSELALLHKYYRGSPSEALQSVYPEHNWVWWKFKTVPHGYWEQKENQKGFFDRLFLDINVWMVGTVWQYKGPSITILRDLRKIADSKRRRSSKQTERQYNRQLQTALRRQQAARIVRLNRRSKAATLFKLWDHN